MTYSGTLVGPVDRLRKNRTLFVYLGRRGGVSRFSLELWEALVRDRSLDASLLLSARNEDLARFLHIGGRVRTLGMFSSALGAVNLAALLRQRAILRAIVRQGGFQNVVTIIPHVWSPLLMLGLGGATLRIVTVVHDAKPHPGDLTGLLHRWCHLGVASSDRIVTLSRSVTEALVDDWKVEAGRILTLFHPASAAGGRARIAPASRPLRLLFLGRILPYKGLPLFVATAEELRRRGISVEIGVFGNGDLSAYRARLSALGAEVRNGWLTDPEIADALDRYDVLVLSHTEASQSGVAALAAGAGMPVVATPVGGLVEQIAHGDTGLIAVGVDAASIADAVRRIDLDRSLYERMSAEIMRRRADISYDRFARELAEGLR